MNDPANAVQAPATLFHAIDQLTILTIELRRLRQIVAACETVDLTIFDQMDTVLAALGCDLVTMRDGGRHDGT